MTRKQIAQEYLAVVQTLLDALKVPTNRRLRKTAVEIFRERVNPFIELYVEACETQSIANDEFMFGADAPADNNETIDVLFDAINGLARAGKDAAEENPELAAHYLKCCCRLGALWLDEMKSYTALSP